MNRCLTLASLLAATLAFATPPAPEDAVTLATRATVDKELLKPLAAKELTRSRYSRSRQPAQARRVRVLDTLKDSSGKEFRTFAVDARHGRNLMDEDEVAANR